jgi:hypothetical protein
MAGSAHRGAKLDHYRAASLRARNTWLAISPRRFDDSLVSLGLLCSSVRSRRNSRWLEPVYFPHPTMQDKIC